MYLGFKTKCHPHFSIFISLESIFSDINCHCARHILQQVLTCRIQGRSFRCSVGPLLWIVRSGLSFLVSLFAFCLISIRYGERIIIAMNHMNGHFRVTLCLCFKTRLRAKPFLVGMKMNIESCNTFPAYKWFHTKHSF